MDENVTVQATSKPHDRPADNRIVLRFETLKRKVRTPEFMHLDEALDRLGVRKFPDEWGMTPVWEQAPFLYESISKRLYKYALKKTEERYRLSKDKFKSDLNRNQLKQCSRIYSSVRKVLSNALSSSLVKAAKLFHDGTIQDIEKAQRGIWSTQMRSIFYSGYAREQSRKFRVLINRASFACWLEKLPDETSITSPSAPLNEGERSAQKTPSPALLEHIAKALADRADERGYVLLRDPLSKLVREALADKGYNLSDRQFKFALWNKDPLKRAGKSGRRSQRNRDKFETDAQELRAMVQQMAQRANENGTQLITPAQAE